MATVHRANGKLIDQLSWYTSHARHSVWDRFSAVERERMLQDDLSAGTRVALLLVALITAGMVLSMVTVLAVLATQ